MDRDAGGSGSAGFLFGEGGDSDPDTYIARAGVNWLKTAGKFSANRLQIDLVDAIDNSRNASLAAVTIVSARATEVFCNSISSNVATFGVSPNYSRFESDGTMVMNGNSTVWDDIQFIATSGKVPASHYPAWTTWNGDFSAYTFAVDDYIDLGAKEVMHGYKEGTDLYPHLHWVVNGTDANERAVKWELVYSTSPSSESSPYTYVFPAPQTLSAEVTLQAGVTDRTSIYQEMGTISGSGLKTGSLIRLRIRRVTAAGTAPSNNPFGFEVGVHTELDTIGSRTRTGK
jgi:hypothetical protein